jgi:sulfide dehydrogenase cytochrome subunit
MARRIGARSSTALFAAVACAVGPIAAVAQTQGFDLKSEAVRCEGCHGPAGRAEVMQNNGRIAGQNQAYLLYILRQYHAGRLSGVNAAIMTYAVKQLSDDDLRALARYYAEMR